MIFEAASHPRTPAGTSTGGQFISYDAAKNRGTGYGKKGGDARVKSLQQALNRLGLTDERGRRLDVDGLLGPLTTQAVKAAQKKLGVKVDGRVSGELLKRLEGLAREASTTMDGLIRRNARRKPARKSMTSASQRPSGEEPGTAVMETRRRGKPAAAR